MSRNTSFIMVCWWACRRPVRNALLRRPDGAKNRLAVIAVKLRESFEANLEAINGRNNEFFKTSVFTCAWSSSRGSRFRPALSTEEHIWRRFHWVPRTIAVWSFGGSRTESAARVSTEWVLGCSALHAYVQAVRGHILVRKDIRCCSGCPYDGDFTKPGLNDQPPRPPRTWELIPLQELLQTGSGGFLNSSHASTRASWATTWDRWWGYAASTKYSTTNDTTDQKTLCPIAKFTNAKFYTWLSGTTSWSTTALDGSFFQPCRGTLCLPFLQDQLCRPAAADQRPIPSGLYGRRL